MSAVKRVQKLLRQAEKRATAGINLEDTRKTEQQKLAELSKAADKREEVFLKATGRAIEKALKVGKWFEEKEAEYSVKVNTGSVLVVDDIVEDEDRKEKEEEKKKAQGGEQQLSKDNSVFDEQGQTNEKAAAKKRKREAPVEDEEAELPETRTRWIKMVEIAVCLK